MIRIVAGIHLLFIAVSFHIGVNQVDAAQTTLELVISDEEKETINEINKELLETEPSLSRTTKTAAKLLPKTNDSSSNLSFAGGVLEGGAFWLLFRRKDARRR